MKKNVLIVVLILAIAACGAAVIISKNESGTEQTVKQPIKQIVKQTVKQQEAKLVSEVKPEFTKETYPKIDGATAMIPMAQEIAMNLLKMNPDEAKSFTKFNKTHPAYVNLIENKADIVFAFGPSEDEIKLAQSKGEELEIVPLGRDAFIFIANVENPVNSLTIKQIQDIYLGKIKNWKEIGGADAPISAYQRPENSGSQTSMERLVMKGLKLPPIPTMIVNTMSGAIEMVATDAAAKESIAYSFYYYAKEMYAKKEARFMAVDGVLPDTQTIKLKTYPLTEDVCAVIRKDEPQDSGARKLIKWLMSSEGQKDVEKGGYVPIM